MLLFEAKQALKLCLEHSDFFLDEDLRVRTLLVHFTDLGLMSLLLIHQLLVGLVQLGLPTIEFLVQFALNFVGLRDFSNLVRRLIAHGRFDIESRLASLYL